LTAPTSTQLQALLSRIIARIVVRLEKDALLVVEDADPAWLNLEPADALDSLNAASVRYRIALGPNAGRRTLTLRNPALERNAPLTTKPQTADQDGFSLNVAVACQPHQRDRLERLCRYITRPAICLERLSHNTAGQIVYQLKHPFRDGSTHVVFSPLDFMAKLAALVPRPRAHLIRYHGVFAPIAHGGAGAAKHRDVRERPIQRCGALSFHAHQQSPASAAC
jgi:hypothetical protein